MKITKSYLKQVIKEELGRMEEVDRKPYAPHGVDIGAYLSDRDHAMLKLTAIGKELGVMKVNSSNPEAAKKYRELIDSLEDADLQKIEGAIQIMQNLLNAPQGTPSK